MKILNYKLKISLAVLLFLGYFSTVSAVTIQAPTNMLANGSTLAQGLVGHWTFDGKNTVGGVAKDLSGQGNTGNLFNIATSTFYSAGKLGQAFNFDGTNDRVSSDTTGMSATTGTFSIWAKRSNWHTGANGYNLFGTITTGVTWAGVSEFQQYDNVIRFYWMIDSGGGTYYFYTSSDITSWANGTWHHIAGTWDSSSAKLYLDGVLVNTDDTVTAPSLGTTLRIGSDGFGTPGQFFLGMLDDARVYSRALSAAEVKQLYLVGGGKVNASSATLANGSTLGSANGLVGHWTFDGKDTKNGVASDLSGQGNHGNLFNIATSTFYTAGKLGQAFNFDGSNDHVGVGDIASIDTDTDPFSISLWVYPRVFGDYFYITNGSGGGPNANSFNVYLINSSLVSGAVSFSIGNAQVFDSNIMTGANTLSLNTWKHIVATYDGSRTYGGMKIYVNGVLQSVTTGSLFGTAGAAYNSWNIGASKGVDGVAGAVHNGKLDDVRVYNRVLSAAEAKQLYGASAPTMQASSATLTNGSSLTSGLVGLWSFDGKDVVSGKVKDRSGSGNDGSPSGIATSTFYSVGKLGQAFKFDGTNDYVQIAPSLSLSTTATISAWVNNETWGASNTDTVIDLYSSADPDGKRDIFTIKYWSSNQQLNAMMHDSSDNWYNAAATVSSYTTGRWYHVAITRNGTSLKIYIDGIESGSAAVSSNNFYSSDRIRIGESAVTEAWQGKIDDVRIYNRALSAAEIKQLYQMR